MAKRNRWYILSAIALAIAFLALGIRGLNWGIEFQGGSVFQAPMQGDRPPRFRTSAAPWSRWASRPPSEVTVTTVGDNQVRVQTLALSADEVTKVKTAIATVGQPAA